MLLGSVGGVGVFILEFTQNVRLLNNILHYIFLKDIYRDHLEVIIYNT